MVLNLRNLLVYIVNLALGVATFFLGFRIIFELFAANPGTPFVAWVYNVSSRLMSPFAGIFPNLSLGGGAIFDIVALLTLIVYAVLAQLVIALIDAATAPAITDEVGQRHHRHLA